jgi:predicted glycosyltransferase
MMHFSKIHQDHGTQKHSARATYLEKPSRRYHLTWFADQCRIAFGLGVPIISTIGIPYVEAVHKLTLPLSRYIVASNAIRRKILEAYDIDGEVVGFDGVDEVAWINGLSAREQDGFGRPMIVVRQLEKKAVFTANSADTLSLVMGLTKLGTVVFLFKI